MDDAVHASARVDTARSPRGRPTAVAVVSRATVAILGLAAVALAFMLIADQQRFAGQREMIIEEESLALRAIAAMLENDLERVVEHTASVGAAPPILRFLTHPSEMTRANVEHELVAVATYSAIYEDIWLIGEDGDVIVHVVYNRGQPIAAAPEAAPRDLNDALAEVRRSGHSYVGPLTDAENVDRRDILIGIGLG